MAVKIPKKTLNKDQIASFRREVEVMSKINHPHIALFMGAYVSATSVKIVTELLSGDFGEILSNPKKYPMTLYERMTYAKQAAEGSL